jgi:hypothetical protein
MNTQKRFAVCIDNSDYEVSLERGKIYQVLPYPDGASHGYVRVIDESGEDYLFDSERFFPITVSPKLQKALKQPGANKSLKRPSPRAPRSARRSAAGR